MLATQEQLSVDLKGCRPVNALTDKDVGNAGAVWNMHRPCNAAIRDIHVG
jgi:hypothetical protein